MKDEVILPKNQPRGGGNPLSLLNGNSSLDRLKPVIAEYKVEYNRGSDPDLKAGYFTNSLGGQKEYINCTILAMNFSRHLFAPFDPNSTDNQPLCQSTNGEAPNGGTDPCVGPCEKKDEHGNVATVCPKAVWQDKKKPECSEVFTILGWDWDDGQLFKFSIKGTSIKHLNRYKARISNSRKWGHEGLPTNTCVKLQIRSKPVSTWYEAHLPHADSEGNPLWERLPKEEVGSLMEEVWDYIAEFQKGRA